MSSQSGRPPAGRGATALLTVEGLRVSFATGGVRTDAVRGIGFTLHAGECLAIVGESGSGKSVTARTLVGLTGPGSHVRADRLELARPEAGAAAWDLAALSARDWRAVRGRGIGLVLQDALVSLDPLRRVGAEVAEALENHTALRGAARREAVTRLLTQAGVPEPELRARQYPHELSGGLRQRALIASAMAAAPAVLVADEPTTALDVTVQARILELLAEQKTAGTGVLLISHDLAVVAKLADRIAVMYQGVFVEEGPVEEVLRAPAHPYTRELLASVPARRAKGARLSVLRTHPAADGAARSDGCRYAAGCPLVTDECREAEPPPVPAGPGRLARCRHLGRAQPVPEAAQALPLGAVTPAAERELVLEVDGVTKRYRGPGRTVRTAVQDVSFVLRAGESLGVLGESGSGKSTLAQLVMGLLEPDAGAVRLLGRPWSGRPESERRALRRRIQLVQQDPLSSFDPRHTVERILGEALGAPGRRSARATRSHAAELLDRVGLDAGLLGRRPRQLSGGQRQRVAIARALAPKPEVIVCDEPVSALDVSVQAQILDLFNGLRADLGVSLVFISHDLGVIYHTSDRVIVTRAGRVVEHGPVEEVFRTPQEAYTKELLSALPQPETPFAADRARA
ncbi:ABC transporter ATP-binding protein [Streptomyces sp. AK02-01A]|uniref:ABC transporter ATP-binding protein n=1 Tax=Streptomyces sp. AK02-01A TaxID=3028648 RepID=UPI0029BA1978|nr:ABC transporter ATP-binding protein [Streptomyces sp. AK02-01A]MDX3854936.1 ABC transporter ATP-binding protein [Streptomyces sp. AK02-01A]